MDQNPLAVSPNIFAVFKPKGPTSYDVVDQIKRRFPGQKVGHAGTLDPLASGVLVIGVGREATKLLHTEQFNQKEYRAVIHFGQTSTTDDAEGGKTDWPLANIPTLAEVEQVLTQFIGSIEQLPPAFSALKIGGTPAYKLARQGRVVELKKRPAEIHEITLVAYDWPDLTITVMTGRGVYIRSLARDLGAALNVGGYIKELERTRVGRFTTSDVTPID